MKSSSTLRREAHEAERAAARRAARKLGFPSLDAYRAASTDANLVSRFKTLVRRALTKE